MCFFWRARTQKKLPPTLGVVFLCLLDLDMRCALCLGSLRTLLWVVVAVRS
jgi:hypothetical protein